MFPNPRQRPLRAAEATALATSVAVILVTYLYADWVAVERNPVIRWLAAEAGWLAVAAGRLGAVALAFALLRGVRSLFPRATVAWAWFVAAVSTGNLLHDLAVVGLHWPETLQWAEMGAFAVVVGGMAGLLYKRPDPRPWHLSPRARQAAAGVAALGMVLSVAFAGVHLGGPQASPVATANAQSTDDIVVFGDNNGNIEARAQSDGSQEWAKSPGSNTYSIEVTEDHVFARIDNSLYKYNLDGTEDYSVNVGTGRTGLKIGPDKEFVYVTGDSGSGKEIQKRRVSDGSLADSNSAVAPNDRFALGPSGDYLYVETGTDTLNKVNTGDLSVADSRTVPDDIKNMDVDKNNVYVAISGGEVIAYGSSSLGEVWTYSSGASVADNVVSGDDHVYYVNRNDVVGQLDKSDGSTGWSTSLPDYGKGLELSADLSTVYVGGSAGTATAVDTSDGSERWTQSLGNFLQSVGATGQYAGVNAVEQLSGQVQDQSGNPVADATVEVWAASNSVSNADIEGQASTLEERQRKLLEQASDPLPEGYAEPPDLRQTAEGDDTQGIQVLAHTPEQWLSEDTSQVEDLSGQPVVQRGTGLGEGLSRPQTVVEAGEPIVLSGWDLSEAGATTLGGTVSNAWVGTPARDQTIVVEKLGPGGSVIERTKRTTEPAYEGLLIREYEAAYISLSPGVYRIRPEGGGPTTPLLVTEREQLAAQNDWTGAADRISRQFAQDLKDRAGNLGQRAQQLRDQLNDGTLDKITVTTDSDGQWSADVPSGYDTVSVTAYKGGNLLENEDLTARSAFGLQEAAREEDYGGAFYSSTTPVTTTVPASGVTVEVRKERQITFTDSETYRERIREQQDTLENETQGALNLCNRVANTTDDSLAGEVVRSLTGDTEGCGITTDNGSQVPDTGEFGTDSEGQTLTAVESVYQTRRGTILTASQFDAFFGTSGSRWDTYFRNADPGGEPLPEVSKFDRENPRTKRGAFQQLYQNDGISTLSDQDRTAGLRLANDDMRIFLESRLPNSGTENRETDTEQVEEVIDGVTETVTRITQSFAWGGDIPSEDNVEVLARYANGTRVPVDDSYWSVNERIGQGDEVVIEDYPLYEDEPAVTFEVRVVGLESPIDGPDLPDGPSGPDDGGDTDPSTGTDTPAPTVEPPSGDRPTVGDGRDTVVNPTVGRIPALEAVQVSSLSPGPSETVTLTVRPEEASPYGSLEQAYLVAPNGTQLNRTSQISGESVSVQTQGAGTHVAKLVFSDDSGNRYTEFVRLQAAATTQAPDPSVRIKESMFGTYAVVGNGLQSGSVDTSGSSVSVAAVVADGQPTPDAIHAHVQQAITGDQQDITVRVLQGTSEQSVREPVTVYVHTTPLSEDTILYREGDQPITRDGTQFGKRLAADTATGSTLQTYTGDDGAVEVTVNQNPSFIESTLFTVRTLTASIDIPAVGGALGGPLTGGGLAPIAALGGMALLGRRWSA